MDNFGIKTPCTQNWENMQPAEKGAYCQSCAKNVIDFSIMSLTDVKRTILASKGKEICGRITSQQQERLNSEFNMWRLNSRKRVQSAFLFSLIVVFGMSVVSCSDKKDEDRLKEVHQVTQAILNKDAGANLKPIAEETKAPETTIYTESGSAICGRIPKIIRIDSVTEAEIPQEAELFDLHMLGGVGYSTQFLQYIEAETIPEERDSLGNIIPTEFAALAYPNPATGPVTLKLDLPQNEKFAIMLIDMNGRTVMQIHNGELMRGTAEVQFDLTDQPAGTYMVAVRSKAYNEIVKVMKL